MNRGPSSAGGTFEKLSGADATAGGRVASVALGVCPYSVTVRTFDVSNHSPQKRHFTASRRIFSLQNGQALKRSIIGRGNSDKMINSAYVWRDQKCRAGGKPKGRSRFVVASLGLVAELGTDANYSFVSVGDTDGGIPERIPIEPQWKGTSPQYFSGQPSSLRPHADL